MKFEKGKSFLDISKLLSLLFTYYIYIKHNKTYKTERAQFFKIHDISVSLSSIKITEKSYIQMCEHAQ